MRRSPLRLTQGLCLFLAAYAVGGSGEAPRQPISGPQLTRIEPLAVLETSHDWVHLLAFLPDGRLLAASWGEARIWRTASWSCSVQIERDGGPGGVIGVSPDGSILLLHTANGEIEIWDACSLHREGVLCSLEGSHRPRTAFSPNGHDVAIKTRGHDVEIWDVDSRELLHVLAGDTSNIFSLAFSPDGSRLAAGTGRIEGTSNASLVRIWDAPSGALVATLSAPTIANCLDLDFNEDGSVLVASGTYGILIFEAQTWTPSGSLVGHRTWSHGAAVSPNGTLLVSAGDEGGIRFWSLLTGELLHEIDLPDKVSCVCFSSDGGLLACAVADGTVRVFAIP